MGEAGVEEVVPAEFQRLRSRRLIGTLSHLFKLGQAAPDAWVLERPMYRLERHRTMMVLRIRWPREQGSLSGYASLERNGGGTGS